MFFQLYDYAMADVARSLGLLGFLVYVINYALLSLGVLSSESARYFVVNIVAAALVLLSLTEDFNLASALIQAFWIQIGAVAVALRLRRQIRLRGLADPAQDAPRVVFLHHRFPSARAAGAVARQRLAVGA